MVARVAFADTFSMRAPADACAPSLRHAARRLPTCLAPRLIIDKIAAAADDDSLRRRL